MEVEEHMPKPTSKSQAKRLAIQQGVRSATAMTKQLFEAGERITAMHQQGSAMNERLVTAREIILDFTRACNKEHVRKGDWACKLCSAGDGWLNGNG